MSREKIYTSTLWRKTRIAYAKSRNCLCERCKRPIYMTGVNDYIPKEKRRKGIVHHKIYLTNDNCIDGNISYSWDNLELLCIDCHNEEHNRSNTIRPEYQFDDEGNIVPNKRA